MTWITRCPECATIYKVVPDQLKVASGWLRCGQCQHAFDSTGMVVPWPGPALPPHDQAGDADAPRVPIDDLLTREDRSASVGCVEPDSMAELTAFSDALTSFKPLELPPSDSVGEKPLSRVIEGEMTGPQAMPFGPSASGQKTDARSIGDSPPRRDVRLAWLLASVLLLQGMWSQRHALATFWPSSAPALQSFCRFVGCELVPWRDPEAMVLESSSFVPREGGFVLQWTVRNASSHVLGMTALEVRLQDAQDKVLVRRVFLSEEVAAPSVLAPSQTWSGHLSLDVPVDLPVTGYRLLSFYP